MIKIDLNGQWQLNQKGKEETFVATVPGCNFLDLMANGVIPDPFVGENEKKCEWVAHKDWVYSKTFLVESDVLDSDSVKLCCAQLDTIADIFVNGNFFAYADNCHIEHTFDIKHALKIGENHIKIVFYSPTNYASSKQKKLACPTNFNGQNGIQHIRKPQCHFGWDWGPVLPPSGISGDICICAYNTAKISSLSIKQRMFDNSAQLDISVDSDIFDKIGAEKADLVLKIICPNGETIERHCRVLPCADFEVEIHDPELWWTHELSGAELQPLYTILATIAVDGIAISEMSKRIGIRTIQLNREWDDIGQNFQFVLNGVPIFAKGADYIPADSFVTRYDREKLSRDIDACLFSNFNMLRVWGGGYYASDQFFDICDERGILVWQDFGFACMTYPFFNTEFRNLILKEAEAVVDRISHRASLCLLCGNNEIELLSESYALRPKFKKWTGKYFHEILPAKLDELGVTTSYIPASPCGTKFLSDVRSDDIGNTHLWAVWHGLRDLNYYRKRNTRFCSEFGFESLPDKKCLDTFMTKDDYDMQSAVMQNHQKCLSGNKRIVYYIAGKFFLPKHFLDYIYMSQITQVECVKNASEHWRIMKGVCNGSLFWQLNDCWPVASWSSMDYYGNFKALQYSARHFFAPTMVAIEQGQSDTKICIVHDKLDSVDCECEWKLIDFSGKVLGTDSAHFELKPNSSIEAFKFTTDSLLSGFDRLNCVLVAKLRIGGKTISEKTHLFETENKLGLCKANTSVKKQIVSIDGIDHLELRLVSDSYLRYVELTNSKCSSPFSDNFFDLLPNEEKIVYQNLDDSSIMGLSNVANNAEFDAQNGTADCTDGISVRSLVDIEPKWSRLADKLIRAKIFLEPGNFFPWLFYLFQK